MTALVLVVLGATVFGPDVEHCRLGDPVFATESLGFVGDACGKLFVTRDGGMSWVRTEGAGLDHYDAARVLSDGSILLAGSGRMRRSRNYGASWSDVWLPSDQMIYELTSRGANVWACGSSGKILHSSNFGMSWAETKSTPTDSENRSISIDFIDGAQGWVAGWYGRLWKTENGGVSWSELTLPAAFAPVTPSARTLDRAILVDGQLGFIFGYDVGTWRTRDGGSSWEKLEIPSGAPRVVRELPGDRRVLVTRDSAARPLRDWVVDLSRTLLPRGTGAVSVSRFELTLWTADGAELFTGMPGPRSGEVPKPDSIHRGTRLWSAVGTHRAFFSLNEGGSWKELPPLPNNLSIEKFVMFEDSRGLARSGDQIFQYEHHTWEPGGALHARDLASALNELKTDPLSCLNATAGRVAMTLGTQGCFGGSSSTLDLAWNGKGGELNAALWNRSGKRQLNPQEVRDALSSLHERALRPELRSGCSSTTKFESSLTVTCTLSGKELVQSLTFETHDCNDEPMISVVGGATTSRIGEQRAGYARALGLRDWANALTPAP